MRGGSWGGKTQHNAHGAQRQTTRHRRHSCLVSVRSALPCSREPRFTDLYCGGARFFFAISSVQEEGESSPRLRRMARLRDHAQAFTQGLTAVGSSAAVLKRVEVDDEGICVTVTLERGGRASGLTLIFEVCEKRTHHPVPPFRFVTLGSAYFFLVLTSRGSARRATCDVATTNESEKIEEHTRSRRRRD